MTSDPAPFDAPSESGGKPENAPDDARDADIIDLEAVDVRQEGGFDDARGESGPGDEAPQAAGDAFSAPPSALPDLSGPGSTTLEEFYGRPGSSEFGEEPLAQSWAGGVEALDDLDMTPIGEADLGLLDIPGAGQGYTPEIDAEAAAALDLSNLSYEELSAPDLTPLELSALDDDPVAFDPAAPSPAIGALAGAVQDALRNVYGADASVAAAPGAVNPVGLELLSLADYRTELPAPQAPDASIADAAARWDGLVREYALEEQPSASELDDNTTEAVLSYLYNQNAPTAAPVFERDAVFSAPASADPAAAYARSEQYSPSQGTNWPEDAGAGRHTYGEAPFTPARSGSDFYRGAALRAPMPMATAASAQDGVLRIEEPYELDDDAAMPNIENYAPLGLPAAANRAAPPEGDGGRMLGAAGLGVIGGIAAAGLVAVFLFNSALEEKDANLPPPTPIDFVVPPADKTQGRLAAVTAGLITARDVSGDAAAPITLAIEISDSLANDNVLAGLRGLPEGARLSAGIDAGGGAWLLQPSRLEGLQIILPPGAPASLKLEAQILQADGVTPVSQPVSFTVSAASAVAAASVAPPLGDGISEDAFRRALQSMPKPPGAQETAGLSALPPTTTAPLASSDPARSLQLIREGDRLMREGDILAARKLYEQAIAMGDPNAAMAMGRSFDPIYFEQLSVKTGTPDPSEAFAWYMKAVDGGLTSATMKIDALKQWMQK